MHEARAPASARDSRNHDLAAGNATVPLTVLSIAYPLAPAGPDAVGGAEQVLCCLDTALMAAGHRSLVIACAGSQLAGTLLATPPPPATIDDAARETAWAACRRGVAEALARWPVDLVHCHGVDFDRYLPAAAVPVLATLHLPPDWYAPSVFRLERPMTWLNGVSAAQHRACPPSALLLPPIANGVPVARLAARHAKRRFALALGRICPEKGFHLALEAARRARAPLLLAGEAFGYPAHRHYFRNAIVPLLDGARRFLGPLDLRRKRRLLTAARCLLVPSLAPETSSLVAMEALACGTPVIAFPAGALPEIVEHGRTGFLVGDTAEMAWAIEAAGDLSPDVCRAVARQRFSADDMAARYLSLYARLAHERASAAVVRRA